MTVRTRFAPSPTGFMHIGNLRTGLYTYLYARKHKGTFILRIEDTDQERKVEGAVEAIYRTLKIAGMDYDEGPDKDGGYGPYVQTERMGLYKEYAEKTKDYSNDKWNNLTEEMNEIFSGFSLCMKNGGSPDSIEVQDLVKELQNHITENYYLCTKEILAGLGQMYVFDERFKNNIDKQGDDTADFVCEAIEVYCR